MSDFVTAWMAKDRESVSPYSAVVYQSDALAEVVADIKKGELVSIDLELGLAAPSAEQGE